MIERAMKALLEKKMMRNMQHKITDKASRKAMGLNNVPTQPTQKKTGQRRRTGSLITEEFTKQPRWRAREWRGVEERVGNNRR